MAEGFYDFTPGQVLTAAQVDDYLMRQAVMRFADASARTTALSGVLVEGMMSYLKDTNTVEVYDGTAWVGVGGVNYGTATGGDSSATITVGGESYTMLTFLSSATLTVTKAGIFDLLIVGGGGGGADAPDTAGGGGAGGFREYSAVYFDANQTVTVGAGGARESHRGSPSSCGDPFAGGGAGSINNTYGLNGPSGGGGGTQLYGRGDGITGNNGGVRNGDLGGGGGGAGAAGGVGSGNTGGAGGAGLDASAFRGEAATTTYYSGGGGGSCLVGTSPGGIGGGGNGALGAAGSGTANTGGGGGGADSGAANAGNGGSGIVLVRFKN